MWCTLVTVLGVLCGLAVSPAGTTPARAAEPQTSTYQAQANDFSSIYRLAGGVLAVDRGTPTVVRHWSGTGWTEVLSVPGSVAAEIHHTDVIVVGGFAIDGTGAVHAVPADRAYASSYGVVSGTGVYTRFSDGATRQVVTGRPGRLTDDGRYLVRTEDRSAVRYDLGTGERTVLTAEATGALVPSLVGAGGRVWWVSAVGTPRQVCSVPLSAAGSTACTPAGSNLDDCLVGAQRSDNLDGTFLRSVGDEAVCLEVLRANRYRMVRLADGVVVTAEFAGDVTVHRRQPSHQPGAGFVVAGADGRVRLVDVDPRTGEKTNAATIDRRLPAAVERVVVDGTTLWTAYRTSDPTADESVIWRRELGETAATAGSFVARGSTVAAAGGRYAVSTSLPVGRAASETAAVFDADGQQIRGLIWGVTSLSGGYLQIADGMVINLDGSAVDGPTSYGPYEGARHVVTVAGTKQLVDRNGDVATVTLPATLGPLSQVHGPWVQGQSGSWNSVTGKLVPGGGQLGDGYRVATDGTWLDLASGATQRWLPIGTSAASIVAVTGRTVVWRAATGTVNSTTIPAAPLPPPRLIDAADTGVLDLSTGAPWAVRLQATRAVKAGVVEIWDGSTLVRSLPTPVAARGVIGQIRWDGVRADRTKVMSGIYRWTLRVAAADGSGQVTRADGTAGISGWVTVRRSPVDPPIWSYYEKSLAPHQREKLGAQVSQTRCGLPDQGCEVVFAGGTMTWTKQAGGALVIGGIRTVWNNHGGMTGRLGAPQNSEMCGDHHGRGCLQEFAGGAIGWTSASKGHPVWGAIGTLYRRGFGGGSGHGILGLPTTDERCTLVRKGCYQIFTNGNIHYSPATGAHWTTGAIRSKWKSYGWERSRLGYPKTNEVCDLVNFNQTCVQDFEGARIIWSHRGGAHALWGAIRTRYRAMGGETGPVWWYPTTDERCGLVRKGCYQTFNEFKIHWSSRSGAHSTSGAVQKRWASLGWERGRLGYPTSELIVLPRSRYVQHFEGGSITMDDRGRTTVSYS